MKPTVTYLVRIPDPAAHRVEIRMSIADAPEDGVLLKMPVWTPGSYLVREYSRHVSRVSAHRAEGDPVEVEKIAKNRWLVHAKPGKRVDVTYQLYANELTVRTSHVDAEHAFLHPSATFLYVDGREAEPIDIEIDPPEGWKVATGLALKSENTWRAESLDHLLDSPFEVGDHQVLSFEVDEVPHKVALIGQGNYDREQLMGDTHTICRATTEMFPGGHPSPSYTFIYHVLEGAGGGLEHLDSSVCGFAPFSFAPARSYVRQLSLIAHEYFHLWNVKRIRPRELGPFDYENEVYSRLLWVAEGFTSYYQWHLLRRADLMTVPDFLDEFALSIRNLREVPGRKVDPVAEASFDAWIKLYRPDENTRNATVSYYLKGGVVALCLDLAIRDASDGERSLDDAMRSLWSLYGARPDEGFSEDELQVALNEAAGRPLDEEVTAWAHGTDDLPVDDLLGRFGLELTPRDPKAAEKAWLGIAAKDAGGKLMVREVFTGTPAEAAGLNTGDEVIAIDGWRVGALAARLGERSPGDEVGLTISRRGRLRKVVVTLGEAPVTDRKMTVREDAGEREQMLFKAWLGAELSEAEGSAAAPPPDRVPRPI